MDPNVPPQLAYMLDFIASFEAPAGYDTLYGNNQHRYSKPITQYTLNEWIRFGKNWDDLHGSSAAGRYQFMNKTLEDIKRVLKLSGSEMMTPNFQDQLGWYLLRRRGADSWMRGEKSDEEFLHELSKEWAALPTPTTGKSYYDGDGRNSACTTVANCLEALRRAKQQVALPVPPKPTPPPVAPPVPMPPEPPAPQGTLIEELWAWVFRGFKRRA